MTETELWRRLTAHLGGGYVYAWANQQVLADLGGRTVREALDAGVACKAVWRAVWCFLELADTSR